MNIEAGIAELERIWSGNRHDGPVMYPDLDRILTAMKTPVECQHEYRHLEPSLDKCKYCGHEKGSGAGNPVKTEPTLAEKFEKHAQNFYGYKVGIVYGQSEKLSEIASTHFAPLIEKARREGSEATDVYKQGYEQGVKDQGSIQKDCIEYGRQIATQELNQKFDICTGVFSPTQIKEIRDTLFGIKL